MTAAEIIRQVSLDLNDQEPGYEYTHWSYDLLKSYLHEGLLLLSAQFKKYFVQQKVVQVYPGGVWQRACECDQILRVLGETTKDGKQILRTLFRAEDSLLATWASDATACQSCGRSYVMSHFVLNEADDSQFKIMPPLPRDEKRPRFVLIECVDALKDVADDYSVRSRVVPMLKQWMLSRAYMVDSENSQAVMQLAVQHRELYMLLVRTEQATLEREEAENGNLRAVPNRPAQ